MDDQSGFFETVLSLIGAAIIWIGGESGRVLIASGLGGLVRWVADEKRHIRTGLSAVIGGAIVGYYLWPLVLLIPQIWGSDPVDKSPENIAMAGFLAGAMGMSSVKIIAALLEARAKSLHKGGPDEQ
jgi:hypothetical protein